MTSELVQTDDGVEPQRMDPLAQLAQRGMMDLALWCIDYEQLIVQGRARGFRMAVSAAVKETITTVCPDPQRAAHINANLLDLPA